MQPYWQTLREDAAAADSLADHEERAAQQRREGARAFRAEADRLERAHRALLDIREIRSQDVIFHVVMGSTGPTPFHMQWNANRHRWVHAHTQGDDSVSHYGNHSGYSWNEVLTWLRGEQKSSQFLLPGSFVRFEKVA